MRPSYPLIADGAAVQWPVQRIWHPAQELVQTPGGAWFVRQLPSGETYEWRLKYAGLTQPEALALRNFHTAMRGSWHSFRFCDPLSNLLAWSEDASQAPWTKPGSLLASPTTNPISGITQGIQLISLGAGESQLAQTVACDPTLPYSFSAMARSVSGSPLGVLIGTSRLDVTLTSAWSAVSFVATPGGTADSVTFAFAVGMGANVELAAIMAECGSNGTEYVKSAGRQGLYAKARFAEDALVVTGVEPGTYAANVTIVASAEE